ncbi:GNAT family N-acetyltransferase [Paenibacillus glycinis]|uniref:GNAT family N-acetyltransferase n=1 Tax=Paenibacillus glycinis TaxID=2697035 RepID=A0ABW9XKV0_9BACL|nr:GNAT family N-acetyltransferase [Paenibacillus glycinis]NBD23235.1 GNAT family N-acetyltransferase [Paenibacillus glycinis]
MELEHRTTEQWNEALWAEAEPIYREGFPEHGRKPKAIVRRMFERGICELHVWGEPGAALAMALTAFDARAGVLVIDYLAVRESRRGEGVGRACVASVRHWALGVKPDCKGLVIEAEAEETADNAKRIRFWEKAGFTLTEYVHAYIWVPETYRAMVMSFDAGHPLTDDGRELFKAITRYHERAYRGRE